MEQKSRDRDASPLRPIPFPDEHFETRYQLYIDAMFYLNAKTNYALASEALRVANTATTKLRSIGSYKDYVANDLGDEIDPEFEDKELEEIKEQEDVLYGAYTQYVQSVITTHVFCAAALEAHINSRAADALTGKLYNSFDKLSLEGKWLILPKMLGIVGFDPGKQPIQGFSVLITVRNSFVHHKASTNKGFYSRGPVLKFAKGLDIESVGKSISVAEAMISQLAQMLGEPYPWWLSKESESFMKFDKHAP
jgi:hypothetical protein